MNPLHWATDALKRALADPANRDTRNFPASPASEFEIDERQHLGASQFRYLKRLRVGLRGPHMKPRPADGADST